MQAVGAVVLTRFVAPAEYGLVALAMLCCRFPNYLSQLGMSRAVVQKPELSVGNIRAAFTLSMGLGAAGCAVIAGVSPLFARFFHEPRLVPVLLVMSVNFVLQGAILVSGGLLRRALRMRELAIADSLSYLISTFAIGLPIAIMGYGAWAIVASTVTQTFFAAILYYAASPHSIRPTFLRGNYEHIVGFGGKATATSIVEGLGGSMDTIAIGRFSSAFSVGLFNRSALLVQLPVQNLSNGLTQVLFSRFSREAASGTANSFELLVRCQTVFLAIIFPLCAGATGAASCIVLTMYGSKWAPAIPVFAVLSAAVAADASFHLPGIQMEALGRFRHKMAVQLMYAMLIWGGIALSISKGLVMVGITLTGLQLCRSLGLHFYTAKYLDRSLMAIMSCWIPGLTAALVVGGAIVLVASIFHRYPGVPPALQLMACMLTGLVVSSTFYVVFYRETVFDPLMRLIGIHRIKEIG
jgi:O-antigen/teichoic acid export membrane protein